MCLMPANEKSKPKNHDVFICLILAKKKSKPKNLALCTIPNCDSELFISIENVIYN